MLPFEWETGQQSLPQRQLQQMDIILLQLVFMRIYDS